MADTIYTIRKSTLTGIANAVREQTGMSGAIPVPNLENAIRSIEGGDSSPIRLKATYKNNIPSIAYGEIVLSATDDDYSGNYDIMWGDAYGVMTNYSKIGTIAIDVANNKTMGSIELMEYNAIPKYATKICAVKNNAAVCDFNIPNEKLWSDSYYGERGYGTLWVSDWHYGYNTAEEDIQRMLTYGKDNEKVIAFVGAGDLTANGYTSELSAWKTLRDTYRGDVPFYTGGGNHEAATANAIMTKNPTGLREYLDTDWTNETESYFLKEIGDDVYIFLSVFDSTTQGNKNTMIPSAQLDWLEEKLELYRNQRVFLSMHIPPLWSLSAMKQNGNYQGFGNGNGAYTLDLWGTSKSDRTRFLNLLDHYKNVIWLSGHSHIKYQYQSVWEHLNIFQYKSGARFVHISSLVVPRDIIDGSATGLIYAESEGTLVEVYPNHIRLRSRNFVDEKFYGGCEYIIDTTPVEIPASSKTVVSITATKTKTSYYTDESFSTSDISISALFSDNSVSDVTQDAVIDSSQVTLSTAGTYSVGISYTYGETTVTTSIQVSSTERPETRTLASISASKPMNTYTVGESLTTADITATASYSDGSSQVLQNSALSIDTSNVDMSNAGVYVINVAYTEGGVTAHATVSVTVSTADEFTVIFDGEWDGSILTKGGSVSAEDVTMYVGEATKGTSNVTVEPSASARSKPLYVRFLSDTGISYSAKVGFSIGIGNDSTKFYKQAQPYYSYTSDSWTAIKTDNDADLELTSSHTLLTVVCKSSSSSTATFPCTVKARIQIGYREE